MIQKIEKITFRELAQRHMGRIIHQRYQTVKDGEKILTFAPIPPVPTNSIRCSSCGLSEWNATNFSCNIHFCPHRLLSVEVTDFLAVDTRK